MHIPSDEEIQSTSHPYTHAQFLVNCIKLGDEMKNNINQTRGVFKNFEAAFAKKRICVDVRSGWWTWLLSNIQQ